MNQKTATPNKSFISETSRGRSRSVFRQIKFIGCKGTYVYSLTCETCKFKGQVQDGLLFGRLNPTCDRDGDSWRRQGRTFYLSKKPCEYFKSKDH